MLKNFSTSPRKIRINEIALIATPLLVIGCVILVSSLSLQAPRLSVSYAMLQFLIVVCFVAALFLTMNCWGFYKKQWTWHSLALSVFFLVAFAAIIMPVFARTRCYSRPVKVKSIFSLHNTQTQTR